MQELKKKISNYWYHYKWHTLITLFFVVTLTIMIVQSATRETSDVYVIYAGPDILTEKEKNDIKDAFGQQVKEDLNGDGKLNVDLLDLIIMNNTQLQEAINSGYADYFLNQKTISNNRETLNTQALAGDYIILLIDPEVYKTMHDNGIFLTLETIGVTAGTPYDDCAVYLKTIPFAKFYTAFDTLPDNTLFCIRRMSTTSITSKKASKVERYYNAHLDFFKSILSFSVD